MACGLPVVITDFGDNRNWVEDGVSGFIVPLQDPKALAEKIIYLLKNEGVRMKFGMRNREIIEDRNNYYKEMEKMENIYMELIERYKS
jgi:glycosyltransferase involved in cell wall biosynthesis